MLKIGVLGAGHLGKIHLNILKNLSEYEVVGFFDPNDEISKSAAEELGLKAFSSQEELIEMVDVIDIVTPTLSHYECASKALKNSKHVFIEKPITHTLDEAKSLISLAEEANVKAQVGHVERFNPAFQVAQPYFNDPKFIETHRLAQFNPRGIDVSVVLDLMIHDLDIILSVVKSNVKRISASGVAVMSDSPDITNARLEFENGCVANLTASRISMKNMRKSRFFQKDAYIAVDFLERSTEIVRMKDISGEPDPFAIVLDPGKGAKAKEIFFEKPEIPQLNAIEEELKSLAKCIREDSSPAVTLQDGYNALSIAHDIVKKIRVTSGLVEEL